MSDRPKAAELPIYSHWNENSAINVYADNSVEINVGGVVIRQPMEKWHAAVISAHKLEGGVVGTSSVHVGSPR